MTTTREDQRLKNTVKTEWGSRLKAARESVNLTEKDAAARLHLKPHIITLIENEAFNDGPPVIFLRGYVRSYARLLNFAEKDIDHALIQLGLTAPPATTISISQRNRSIETTHSYTRWATVFILLMLISLVGLWWKTHSYYNTTSPESPSKPLPPIETATSVTPVQTAVTTAPTPTTTNTPDTSPVIPLQPATNAPISTNTPRTQTPAPNLSPPAVAAATPVQNNAPAPAAPSSQPPPSAQPGLSNMQMALPEGGLDPEDN